MKKTILIFYGIMPVLEISELDVKSGPNLGVKYGTFRDRNPDRDYSEIQKRILENAKEVELTNELENILLEDLAYVYGNNTKKFREKLIEFKILK